MEGEAGPGERQRGCQESAVLPCSLAFFVVVLLLLLFFFLFFFCQKALESLAGPSKGAVIKEEVDSIFTIRHSKASEQRREKSCFCWKEKGMSVKLIPFLHIHKTCLSQHVTCLA